MSDFHFLLYGLCFRFYSQCEFLKNFCPAFYLLFPFSPRLTLFSLHQVRTQTQTLISLWRRRGVCQSHLLRVTTMCVSVGGSNAVSNAPITVRDYSLTPPTMAPKVLLICLLAGVIHRHTAKHSIEFNISKVHHLC